MRAAAGLHGPNPLRRFVLSTLFAALALSGAVRESSAASTGAYYELVNQNSQTGNTALGPTWVTDNTGLPVTTGIQTIGPVVVTASAAPGVLRASVWSTSVVQSVALTGVSDYASSHAAAQFTDRITLGSSNPALLGTTVTVNASLLLDGGMLATYLLEGNNSGYFDVYARTVLSVSGTGITGFVTAEENHGNHGGLLTNVSRPAPSVIPIQFTSQVGSLTSIQYQLDLQGYSSASFGFRECGGGYGPCGALASALVDSDYAHSVVWGGISSVTDAIGNPIPDFTVVSESGFDYAVAVPEPGGFALVATGGILLGLGRRCSRRAAHGIVEV